MKIAVQHSVSREKPSRSPSPLETRGFFLGLPLGLAALLALFFVLFYRQLGAPTATSNWCAELIAKKERRASSMPHPKLVLAGGSSVLFGLKARQIQEATGWPTLNFGLHGALGPQYILSRLRQVLEPGDLVLLGFEYELYNFGKSREWRDSVFLDYVTARDPEYFRALPLVEQFRLAMSMPLERIRRGLQARRHPPPRVFFGVYDVDKVDEFGDQNGNTADLRPPGSPQLAVASKALLQGLTAHQRNFAELERFLAWARARQVRVLATFPGICHRPEYDAPNARGAIEAIRGFYSARNIPVLGGAREAMLPSDLFFDTNYHPTQAGARERTRRLLTHLPAALERGQKNPAPTL